MTDAVDVEVTKSAARIASFSLRRTVYVPLMLSLTVSLPLTAVVVIAAATGWFAAISPDTVSATSWAAALAIVPQTFVICVSACWLLFGLLGSGSRRWLADNNIPKTTEPAL